MANIIARAADVVPLARGDYRIHRIDYARELSRSVNGRAAAPPSCIHEEHRGGVCPHGNRHRDARELEGRNTIVSAPKASIIDRLVAGNTGALDLRITAVAVGTSADPTTPGMTQLASEFYRLAPSDVLEASELTASVFWFLSVAVGNAPSTLQEFAVLCGGATTTPGTGTAWGRFLQPFPKDGATTMSGQYDTTIL